MKTRPKKTSKVPLYLEWLRLRRTHSLPSPAADHATHHNKSVESNAHKRYNVCVVTEQTGTHAPGVTKKKKLKLREVRLSTKGTVRALEKTIKRGTTTSRKLTKK